jgi:hypothetical protein
MPPTNITGAKAAGNEPRMKLEAFPREDNIQGEVSDSSQEYWPEPCTGGEAGFDPITDEYGTITNPRFHIALARDGDTWYWYEVESGLTLNEDDRGYLYEPHSGLYLDKHAGYYFIAGSNQMYNLAQAMNEWRERQGLPTQATVVGTKSHNETTSAQLVKADEADEDSSIQEALLQLEGESEEIK